ncbi:MAG: HAD-IB family phosphatase [Candidatus Aminicenantes bacterium]|nr:HAD-IB family phosphatase [Candidatus Aminicenantes bacterium]
MLNRFFEWLGLLPRRKVSVVIPVLNEEKTVGKVVRLAKKSPWVGEVIVVDDNSADSTFAEAEKSGAKVLKSAVLGKGYSMWEGMNASKNDILVFLDGDIGNYEADIVSKLAEPILRDRCDFAKATFSREAGRVTELVAKPLLSILFPDLAGYAQPLSGMIAAKKEFLKGLKFENDYGVDIGILIDAHNRGARILEIEVGRIDNKSKPWQALGKMSREVSKAILKRAEIQKILSLDELETINVIRDEMEDSITDSIKHLHKMAIFDMDDTLLMERFINAAADRFGFRDKLEDIRSKTSETYVATKMIAALLKDVKLEDLLALADGLKIVPDAAEVIKTLKSRGFVVGIVSDSYDLIADFIRNKVGADFALANHLEVKNRAVTGEVRIPSYFVQSEQSPCSHPVCKVNALFHLAEKYDIKLSDMIAVGDSVYDVCIVRAAGIGVAFCSTNGLLNAVADKVITTKSFREILEFTD